MSTTPAAILDVAFQQAEASIAQPIVTNPSIAKKIDYVSSYVGNRAIDRALQKINNTGKRVDNYIFITTDVIEEGIREYASSMYERTGGIEIVVLDCISFVRHFLHLFHRLRSQFLSAYQQLVLREPDSAVSQPLKEAFLALRQAAESAREF